MNYSNSEFTVYIKPTNHCTVDCEHCYIPKKVRENKNSMTLTDLKKIFHSLLDISNNRPIHIIWHGGEPMMLNPKWYEEAFVLADNILGVNNYTSSIQTSLVPYTRQWNNLFISRFSFIGSSIDFSMRKINDSSDEYMKNWLNNVKKIQEIGLKVVPSFVPSKNEIGKEKEIVNWAIKHNFKNLGLDRFNLYQSRKHAMSDPKSLIQKNHNLRPSNLEHSKILISFLDAIIDSIKKNGVEKTPFIPAIFSGINGVVNKKTGDRWGTSCQKNFLVIEPDGSTNSCPDRSTIDPPFSNIKDGSNAFLHSKDRRLWLRYSLLDHKQNHCQQCQYNVWCKSACPITENTPFSFENNSDCSGFSFFLNHVSDLLLSKDREHLISYIKS